VNTDRSVRDLKGPNRPINPEEDRLMLLAALESVDAVSLFDEPTPLELIAQLLPDVLVKGGDYTPDRVVGAEEVEAAGGRVAIAPLVPGRSTTRLIQQARAESMP
jgi:rfaE bifunctional protein nucleotidyltransferase chain/domain